MMWDFFMEIKIFLDYVNVIADVLNNSGRFFDISQTIYVGDTCSSEFYKQFQLFIVQVSRL